jgi:two-component system KDP operon response regulator KdpE
MPRSPTRCAALDAGADDYVTKPFGMDEVLARCVPRSGATDPDGAESRCVTAGFQLDLAQKSATVGDATVHLTPTEWAIVEVLVRHPGRLVTQRHLLQEVWGPQYEHETNYLRVHLAAIRKKLEPTPGRPRFFVTEPGIGYRFEPETQPDAD